MATAIADIVEKTTEQQSVLTANTGESAAMEPLSETTLRRLYSYMLQCRTVEEKIRILSKQGRFGGNYFAAVGQEATAVGTTLDLLEKDAIAPSHRSFITHIMKGTPLKLMFAQLYGRKTSPDQGRSAPAHCGYAPLNVITPSSTIAAQLNIGTGIALAYKMRREPNVVVALSGDGSTSLGFWHEAMNFAGVQKLPMAFVVIKEGVMAALRKTTQGVVLTMQAPSEAEAARGVPHAVRTPEQTRSGGGGSVRRNGSDCESNRALADEVSAHDVHGTGDARERIYALR